MVKKPAKHNPTDLAVRFVSEVTAVPVNVRYWTAAAAAAAAQRVPAMAGGRTRDNDRKALTDWGVVGPRFRATDKPADDPPPADVRAEYVFLRPGATGAA